MPDRPDDCRRELVDVLATVHDLSARGDLPVPERAAFLDAYRILAGVLDQQMKRAHRRYLDAR